MERHVEVVSDLWTAKELIAGVHVLLDVISAVALAAVAGAQRAVNKKAFVINSQNYI